MSKPANAAPEAFKNADASFAVARVLLVPAFAIAMFTAALMWLSYGTSLSMVAALFLLFFMLAVSLLLGMMLASLMGARHKEEKQRGREWALKGGLGHREREEEQRQQEIKPREAEQDRPKVEQGERVYRSTHQDGGGAHTVPISPKELRALPYKEYLRTLHWKRKREEKLRAAGYKCQVCNRGGRTLEVHHRTYDRRGEELDQDLTVLCRSCHTNFHKNRSLGR